MSDISCSLQFITDPNDVIIISFKPSMVFFFFSQDTVSFHSKPVTNNPGPFLHYMNNQVSIVWQGQGFGSNGLYNFTHLLALEAP